MMARTWKAASLTANPGPKYLVHLGCSALRQWAGVNLLIVNIGACFSARRFSQIISVLGFFFLLFLLFFFFFFIFGDLCIYCKLGAEVASPVSAAKLGWTSMLVAAGANFPRCSLMVLQECMVFSIGKPHRIWFGIITTTAVEHLGGCLLKGVQVAECF